MSLIKEINEGRLNEDLGKPNIKRLQEKITIKLADYIIQKALEELNEMKKHDPDTQTTLAAGVDHAHEMLHESIKDIFPNLTQAIDNKLQKKVGMG